MAITNSDENIEKLAEMVVESMDLGTLVEYAQAQLAEHYMNNEESFLEDWKNHMEDVS